MKYVTFAIMAVLIFGVAAAPIFSNGMVFAQTEKQVAIDKKEKTAAKKEVSTERKQVSVEKKEKTAAKKEVSTERKETSKEKRTVAQDIQEQRRAELEERRAELEEKRTQQTKKEVVTEKKEKTTAKIEASTEKKQVSVEKKQNTVAKKEVTVEKKKVSKELQEQRRAELEEINRLLQVKLAEQERIDRERMQDRFDAMTDRSPMTDAINRLNQANSPCGTGTIFDSETNSCVLDLVYSGDGPTDNTQYNGNVIGSDEHQNTPLDNTGTYFDKLRHTMSEQKISQDNLFRQITMLLNLVDSMCEDKVLVAGVTDGKLRCLDSDRAFNMHSRGLVTLVG